MKALLVELRAVAADVRHACREFFSPTWSHDDDPPDLKADAAKRTAWVRKNRHPKGGDDVRRAWDW